METTFDLPDSLVEDVMRVAKARGTTSNDLVREALVSLVVEADQPHPFVLTDLSQRGWNPKLTGTSLQAQIAASYDRVSNQ